MAESPAPGATFEVACPHCKKVFAAALMSGSAGRHLGFKCKHCRLFVPYERIEERTVATAPEG
jgi:tRNA(Ile2) C34 agmatinyltransferase TiaS